MTHAYLKDKNFYKAMLAISLPIAMQNLISSSLNMVDTVIIGGLGETRIAAVGLANQVFFLFVLLMFGLNSGCSIFTAQFWGKKDVPNIRRVVGLNLSIGCTVSLAFTALAFFAPGVILGFFTPDKVVIDLGSHYLRIICLSYLFTAISFVYSFALRNIGQAKTPMIVSAIALVINTVLNFVMVYGLLGFPKMDIAGSAIATVIARGVELLLVLWFVYGKNSVLAGTVKEMLSFSFEFVSRVFKTAAPVVLNEALWSLGITMYSVAYARISTEAVAAVQISGTIQNIFMVFGMSLGNACAVMLGNELGAGNRDKAIAYSNTFSLLSVTIGAAIGAVLIVLAPFTLRAFNISPEVYKSAHIILILMGIIMAPRVYNMVLIVGILRSGGDTKYSLYLEMCSIWIVGVPLAFLGAILWKLPVYWVYGLICLEEVVKASFGLPRALSKKWAKNVVEDIAV